MLRRSESKPRWIDLAIETGLSRELREHEISRGHRPVSGGIVRPVTAGQTLDHRVVIGLVEEHEGQPTGHRLTPRRVDHPVSRRPLGVIGPSLHQVADVDDERVLRNWYARPLSVCIFNFQPSRSILGPENRQGRIVGMCTYARLAR